VREGGPSLADGEEALQAMASDVLMRRGVSEQADRLKER
jgi:hypothetical protein